MNHALTAHALPFRNTENNVLANANQSACASRRGMIYHVPFVHKNNIIPDRACSAPAKNAIIRCENLLQSVLLFCNKKKVFANKPSILMFAKNQQTADNQSFAQNNT